MTALPHLMNIYEKKSNINASNKCECGQTESISDNLLECPQYENERSGLQLHNKRVCDKKLRSV